MLGSVQEALAAMAQAANNKINLMVNSLVSGGLVVGGVATQKGDNVAIGGFFATNGHFGLSYMEYFAALGATWIIYQLTVSIYDRFIARLFKRKKTDGQQTGQ